MIKLFPHSRSIAVFIPGIMILLALFRGGREVLGLSVFLLASLAFVFLFLRDRRPEVHVTALDVPVLALCAVAAVSAAVSLAVQMKGAPQFVTLLTCILLFYLMVRLRADELFERVFAVYLAVCAVLGAVVSFQGLLRWEEFMAQTILPHAHFPNHNLLAGFMAPGVVAAVCLLASKKHKRPLTVVLTAAALGIMLLAEFFMFSRGAMVAVAAGLAFVAFVNVRSLVKPALLLAAFCLLAFILLPKPYLAKWVHHKLHTEVGSSRTLIWKVGFRAFLDRPLLGWGLGGFSHAYRMSALPCEWEVGRYERYTRFAHNEYLHSAVETGVLGFAAFLLLAAAAVREGARAVKRSGGTAWHVTAAAAGTAAILTHSFFDFNLHLPAIAFLLTFFVSGFVSVRGTVTLSPAVARFSRISALALFAAVAVLSSSFLFAAPGTGRDARRYAAAALLNPFNSGFRMERARLEPGAERRERFLMQAAKVDPRNPDVYRELARHYGGTGLPEKAADSYRQALAVNPRNPFFHAELADVHYRLRQYREAFDRYAEAARLEPFYIYPRYRMAEIAYMSGRRDAAVKELDSIRAIDGLKLTPGSGYSQRLLDYSYKPLAEKLRQELAGGGLSKADETASAPVRTGAAQ